MEEDPHRERVRLKENANGVLLHFVKLRSTGKMEKAVRDVYCTTQILVYKGPYVLENHQINFKCSYHEQYMSDECVSKLN